jgi:hypothetical protein
LRNESAEKDRALIEVRHNVQKQTYERDSNRTELNKNEYKFKQKQNIIG